LEINLEKKYFAKQVKAINLLHKALEEIA